MSKLSELINSLCPDGVTYKPLGDLCVIKKGTQLNKENLLKEGKYPVINGGISPSGFWNEYNFEKNSITISQGGASAGYVNFITTNFWAGAHCYVLTDAKNCIDYRLLYHIVKNYQKELMSSQIGAGIPSVSSGKLSNLQIPIPPIEVQREIVRILDAFTELQQCLQTELTARKKQYAYYRDKLLNVEGRIKNVECLPLCQIADIGTGSSNTDEGLSEGKYPFFVRSSEILYKNEYEFDETAIITAGDGVGVGKVYHFISGKYALHQRAYRIHITSDKLIPKYLFYFFKSAFLPYIQKTMYQGSVASIRRPMLNNFMVPIPPLDEQERIVVILDRFDTLCNDLTQGLPAEIEARKKQYEYYREKLLSFQNVPKGIEEIDT